jgi:hypothetical protein
MFQNHHITDSFSVIKKSLCTWWLQYRKLQVMFKVSPANLQIFIDIRLTLTPSVIPNCNDVIIVSDWKFLKYRMFQKELYKFNYNYNWICKSLFETPCIFLCCNHQVRRSQWPRDLRWTSTASRLLRSWVRFPQVAWMFICCVCVCVCVCFVCCQVEFSATSWSLVQRIPTEYGASLCVTKKPRERGHSPYWAAMPEKIINNNIIIRCTETCWSPCTMRK